MSKKKPQGTNLLYQLIGEARSYDDVIVMGRGDPDFDTPAHIVAAAKEAMIHHHADYTPPQGLPPCVRRSPSGSSASTISTLIRLPRSSSPTAGKKPSS